MKRILLLLLLACVHASYATIHIVNVNALSFSPANLTIQQGDTVRWIKPAGGFHNVVEVSTPPVFNSGEPTSNAFTYNFAFNAPLSGTYNYECIVHAFSGMTGTVTVQGGGNPPDAPTYLGPMNGATGQPTNGTLSWNPSAGAEHYIVRLGTSNPPPVVNNNFTGTTYNYSGLSDGTMYWWQITAVNQFGPADGNIWSFTTAVPIPLPGQATNPDPADGSTNVQITTTLVWDAASNAVSYEIFLGTAEPLVSIGTTNLTSIQPPSDLSHETTYLWRVNSINETGTTAGLLWSFTTEAASAADDAVLPKSFKVGAAYPNPFNNNVRINLSVAQESQLQARIFDISGREVTTLANGRMNAGEHRLEWNAAGQSAGLYFLHVTGAGITQTQKLIYLP
ncbi:T9SS type A sorting domain-containing protein [bacterium]|nr:T9SS type A sorting domain-containing protein [bacterium]